jgi:hypothetical protein
MEETMTRIERLLDLFEEREQIHEEITQVIMDELKPTLIEALLELFDTPAEHVMWGAIEVEDTTLTLICTVFHQKGAEIPQFLTQLVPDSQASEIDGLITRSVRVGLPVRCLFLPKDEIIAYLKDMIAQSLPEAPAPAKKNQKDTTTFDASKLTEDQVLQMLVFQHQTKGTTH